MTTTLTSLPDFRSPGFLRQHVRDIIRFYVPAAIDRSGGMYHFLRDDGSVYNPTTRHLVSSTRLVVNFANLWRMDGDFEILAALKQAYDFVDDVHRDSANGGYIWMLDWNHGERKVLDDRHFAYGLAFVLLAQAHAFMAGLPGVEADLHNTFELLEQRFWEPAAGLYADEATRDWMVSPYRGQNANMHLCEALITAFDATGNERYLERAAQLADNITLRQAGMADGLVWEHYHQDWSVDWDYNRDDKTNIFKPWGFQPGHLTEWSKLLLLLHARLPHHCWVERAERFFRVAMAKAWDSTHGGLAYGFAPDGSVCDSDKYFWVQAESIAAAARLATVTGDGAYWQDYDRLWQYAWAHFVDHEHGAWYRILRADNSRISDEKSPAGKVDYHTIGACLDVLDSLGEPLESDANDTDEA